MKKIILSTIIISALLLTGCGIKRDCDTKQKEFKKNQNVSKADKKNKKIYTGE